MATKKKKTKTSKLFPEDQREMFEKSYLEEVEAQRNQPVECLGMTFENDEIRREYFLEKLREKLKDPEFRKIEGFPIGEDEDILALSDPPYYTACPNPFIEDFLIHYGKPYDPGTDDYRREPFATDVSEGKNDPIYKAHSYHTKVPHKAIMRYILHYTDPGDIVFDGFCGTGMTGVAAQLCGDKTAVESLGYKVERDGSICQQEEGENGKTVWTPFSKLGKRWALLNDLSPAATFIASNYNTPVDLNAFDREAKCILREVEVECGWMYETLHADGKTRCKINYTVWSDVFVCPDCASEIVFWDAAVDKSTWQVSDDFCCSSCGAKLGKRGLDRVWTSYFDDATGDVNKLAKQVPVLIHYKLAGGSYTKSPDSDDLGIIEKISKTVNPYWYPTDKLPEGDKMSDPRGVGIQRANDFYSKRALYNLSKYCDLARKSNLGGRLLVNLTSSAIVLSRQYRFRSQGGNLGAGGGPMNGTLYVPSLIKEIPVTKVIGQHIDRMSKVLSSLNNGSNFVQTCSLSSLQHLESDSVDYVFIDPPFGSNIMYSELNFLWESWLRVKTNNKEEAIENRTQKKRSAEYRQLMADCFTETYRSLKPGRWMTVEFSNTKAAVWNSIQIALTEAGFIVANVSSLDKKQGSFNAVTNTTSVKQDLIISAYKPNGGFEERFVDEVQTEEGVWDFVRTHLKYLPVIKKQGGGLVPVPERDPRILFDQMVAYYVRKGYQLPISSQEFQLGLAQRFPERDGIFFLPDQAAEYDKKRMTVKEVLQLQLFVSDEASAIQWLKQQLTKKPQTFQDVHPQFLKEIGGWQKHEKALELSELLGQNFLRYDSKGEVPSQIHSYLSSNFKELRNQEKDDTALKAKAKDRWYVPDPNKAGDLEKLRERTLMKEFWEYLPPGYEPVKFESLEGYIPGLEPKTPQIPKGKKIKVIRLEAVRVGFKYCWQNRDYRTIIAVAQRIPEKVLQEDSKLLMWYDSAVTRSGEE